jgi:alcohol dehydrogenase class IV
MSPTANWNYPTAVRFGAGRIAELGEACKVAGITRPLIVTDPGIARLPIAARVRDLLAEPGLEAGEISDVQANPTEDTVSAGFKVLREGDND